MTDLFFTDKGSGPTVVLIHGFPFDHRIWDEFSARLADRCRVITIDLPGFGKSALEPMSFSIDDIGTMVAGFLRDQRLSPCTLAGHSLGGYVALSVAANYPELLEALVLFHSTAQADSAEKRESRNKAIGFVDEHGVKAFTSGFISPLFAQPDHPGIAKVRAIASEARASTVKGYLLAMRDRKDRVEMLAQFPKPVLFIAGEKDGGIPVDAVRKQASLPSLAELHVLPEVGHMGMFEDTPATIAILSDFVTKD